MRCISCEQDNWENVDQFRMKPEGMSICKSCGFVSYPARFKTEEEIKAHYRTEARTMPNVKNIYTGQSKLNYHRAMLSKYIQKWNEEKKHITVFETGSAMGLFLNWLRHEIKSCDVNGSELALAYRRVAFHEYNLNLSEDFDYTKKYDLIASYKVAEHQFDVDKKLRSYVECLKDDGIFYIGVPTWFGTLHNFGLGGLDIEYYYHPDHINAWTITCFENLLKKVGLEIIEADHFMYDDVYICKRNDSLMAEYKPLDEYKANKENLDKIKKAWDMYSEGKFKESIQHWQNNPMAYINMLETSRVDLHKRGLEAIEKDFIEPMLADCKREVTVIQSAADIYMRYKSLEKAVKLLNEALEKRPFDQRSLHMLSTCMRIHAEMFMGNEQERTTALGKAREITKHLVRNHMAAFPEGMDMILNDCSKIPMPSEKTSATL